MIAGDQVPDIPFCETNGRGFIMAPEQAVELILKVGVVAVVIIVMVMVVGFAHWLLLGVKVYVVVEVLFNAGDQVPVIPLIDVVGNAEIVFPLQTGATWLKVGFTFGLIVIVNVVVVAHWPILGVKV